MWNSESWQFVHALVGHQECVRSCRFSWDSRRLATGDDNGEIRVGDVYSLTLPVKSLDTPSPSLFYIDKLCNYTAKVTFFINSEYAFLVKVAPWKDLNPKPDAFSNFINGIDIKVIGCVHIFNCLFIKKTHFGFSPHIIKGTTDLHKGTN